ncbi:hypothetical protein ACJROX_07055 [Pseudalkalibacillus sp. A8]
MRNKLKAKLKYGEIITYDDVKTAIMIAKRTGHTDDRVLLAKLKYAYEAS